MRRLAPHFYASAVLTFPLLVAGCGDDQIATLTEAAAFDPMSIDFGEVLVGTTASQAVLLKNTGSVGWTIRSVDLPDSFSLRSEKANLMELSVPAGAEISLDVLFLGAEEGERTGTLVVHTDRAQAQLQVRAVGVIRRLPNLRIEPAMLDFGTVVVGEEARLPVNIINDGNDRGLINSATLESVGALGMPFDLTGGPTMVAVEPGASLQYEAVFRPTREGPVADRMVFDAVAPQEALFLNVQGNGAPAQGGLVCTPSAVSFGPVERGDAASTIISCRASGGVARFISATLPAGETLFALPIPPGTADLTDGQTVEFEIQFRAEGEPATHNSTLTVQYNGDNGVASIPIPINGEVIPPPVTATAMSILLTWDSNFTDVDLHLVRPGGMPFDLLGGTDCYYAERSPDWGIPNDPTDDPFLDVDDTDGLGPENINLNVAAPGNYEVYVHYYNDNFEGPTNATLEVFVGGNLAGTFSRQINCNDMWHAGTVQWNGTTGTFSPSTTVTPETHGFCGF